MTSTNITKTIECPRSCVSSYGIPEQVVSDNGQQFMSDKFKRFVTTNGIKHTLIPAYLSYSKGAAEISVLKQRQVKVCDGMHGSLN